MTHSLNLTYEAGEWVIWFATPFNHRRVLATFGNFDDAQAYYDEQVESAQ